MNKNETALEMCLRMLRERAEYWKSGISGDSYIRGMVGGRADAYTSAACMLEYAMQDNIECLRQFDYYHKDEEEK